MTRPHDLLHGPWTWRAKWPLYAGSATALVGVVVAVVLVVPGGGGSKDQLLADDPTPTATLDATPSPSPSVSEAPTGAPGVSTEASTPSSPRMTISGAEPRLLLSDSFMERSFGAGRSALVQVYANRDPILQAQPCLGGPGQLDAVRSAGRTWSWPDEIVAEELIVEASSPSEAQDKFEHCADPATYRTNAAPPVAERLDVGDGGYLVQERHALYRSLHAGARVGVFLVLVEWRQSGRVTSPAPIERALRAAVAKATGGKPLEPLIADRQQTESELRGYLTRSAFPSGFTQREAAYAWTADRGDTARIYCGVVSDPERPGLRTALPAVWRDWAEINYQSAVGGEVSLAIAAAADSDTAMADFEHCRTRYSGATAEAVADLGDEAFYVNTDKGNGEGALYIRDGSTYLVVDSTWQPRANVEAFARAAFAAWQNG